jgi:hypothetical protein
MNSRRFVGGLVRLGLVVLAVFFVSRSFGFGRSSSSRERTSVKVETQAPPEVLGPGDLRIYNADSTIDLVLRGDNILAGLSPKTVSQINAKIDTSTAKDTTGLSAGIASIVKKSVAGAIGTHAVFPVSDIRDIRYENDQIIFDWNDGRRHQIFENTNINGRKASRSFRREDAERFIEAVKARKRAGGASSSTS